MYTTKPRNSTIVHNCPDKRKMPAAKIKMLAANEKIS